MNIDQIMYLASVTNIFSKHKCYARGSEVIAEYMINARVGEYTMLEDEKFVGLKYC